MKKLFGKVLWIVMLALMLSACGGGKESDGSAQEKKSSSASESKKKGKEKADFAKLVNEDYGKLDDFPEVKEALLAFGNGLLEENVTMEEVKFRDNKTSNSLEIVFHAATVERQKEYVQITHQKINEKWSAFHMEADICDQELSDNVAKRALALFDMTQEERDLIFDPEYAKEAYTENFWLSYQEEEGNKGKHWHLIVSYEPGVPANEQALVKKQRKEAQDKIPTGDGVQINLESYGISFYIPSQMQANEYNGMLGVYDYYSGTYSGNSPSGVDLNLVVTGIDDDMTAETYAKTKSRAARYEGMTEFWEKELNGITWWTGKNGKFTYYATTNQGCVYEFYLTDGQDFGVTLADLIALFEKTVYLY